MIKQTYYDLWWSMHLWTKSYISCSFDLKRIEHLPLHATSHVWFGLFPIFPQRLPGLTRHYPLRAGGRTLVQSISCNISTSPRSSRKFRLKIEGNRLKKSKSHGLSAFIHVPIAKVRQTPNFFCNGFPELRNRCRYWKKNIYSYFTY